MSSLFSLATARMAVVRGLPWAKLDVRLIAGLEVACRSP